MRRMRKSGLTISHRGRRYVVAFDADSFQVWKRGLVRDRCLATFPHSDQGATAAIALLAAKTVDAEPLPPPGEVYRPARVIHALPALAVVLLALAVAGVAAAVAVSGGHNTSDAASRSARPAVVVANGQEGWLYAGSGFALFLTWTRTGDGVTGALQTVGLADGGTSVAPVTASFTGSIAGEGFTLTFPQGLGTVTNIAGTMSGRDLILTFPENDGTLAPVTLKPGDASAYNADVTALQGTAAANGQAQQQASAAAASASAQAAAQDQLDAKTRAAAQAVTQDVSDLAEAATSLNSSVSSLNPEVSQASKDVTKTRQDAQIAEQDARSGDSDQSSCTDADTAQDDAYTVADDQNSLGDDVDGVQETQSSVAQAISALKADEASWQQLDQQDPDVATAPDADTVAQAIGAANTAMSTAQDAISQASASVQADVNAAQASANAAKAAAC